jgi:hypothetical protein
VLQELSYSESFKLDPTALPGTVFLSFRNDYLFSINEIREDCPLDPSEILCLPPLDLSDGASLQAKRREFDPTAVELFTLLDGSCC